MGIYTENGFFYKPAFGASGPGEKKNFDEGLDGADSAIQARLLTSTFNSHEASSFVSGDKAKLDAIEAEANKYTLEVHNNNFHTENYITDYTVTQTDVTQHQGALSITESQISDLKTYLENIEGESIGNLSDVNLTGIENDKILKYNSVSGNWEVSDDEGTEYTAGTGLTLTGTEFSTNDSQIDHNSLSNYEQAEHRTINDSGTGLEDLWSANKIDSEISSISAGSIGDLSDVLNESPDNRHSLVYNSANTRYENRLLVEADISDLDHYDSTDFDTDFAGKSTTDLSEGTNLYHTDARAVTAIKENEDWNATNWDTAHGWGDHSAAGYFDTVKNSIELDLGALQLTGDSATPGNSKYYGTNDTGTKGFFDLPEGGEGGDISGTIATSQVAFGTATDTIGGDNSLVWDNTNKRLGVGETTPLYGFHFDGGDVSGSAADPDYAFRLTGMRGGSAFGLEGEGPSIFQECARDSTSGLAFSMFKLRARRFGSSEGTNPEAWIANIGILGSFASGSTAPIGRYIYMGADSETSWNNAFFKIAGTNADYGEGLGLGVPSSDHPEHTLDVRGDGSFTGDLMLTADLMLPNASGASNNLVIGGNDDMISTFSNSLVFYPNRAVGDYMFTFRSHSNRSDYRHEMLMDPNGNLGINNDIPTERLDVGGNIAVSGTVDGVDLSVKAPDWDTAYGWGDHSLAGYLTEETDPIFSSIATAETYGMRFKEGKSELRGYTNEWLTIAATNHAGVRIDCEGNSGVVFRHDESVVFEYNGFNEDFIIHKELSLESNKITNLLDPTAAQDAATKNYVDTNSATVAGANTEIQYNNAGNLGASSNFRYDGSVYLDPETIPTGAGTRLMWIPSSHAFLVGNVTGTQFDTVRNYSTSIGRDAECDGQGSIAMGYEPKVSGGIYTWGAVSIGRETNASSSGAVALGYQTTASGQYSTATGAHTEASGDRSFAMGAYCSSENNASLAGGLWTTARGDYSFAYGERCWTGGDWAVALGRKAYASANGSFTLADSQNDDQYNSTANRFVARFAAGYVFNGGDITVAGKVDGVDIAALANNAMGTVNHGDDATVARPTGYAAITWVGSVEPNNWENGDIWYEA